MPPQTKILACTCRHPVQDALYGKGLRVHNYARKGLNNGAWRCTVCQHLQPAPSAEPAPPAKPASPPAKS